MRFISDKGGCMGFEHDIMRKRIYERSGIVMCDASYLELLQSEWSPKFEQLMRNRLVMGAIRHGRLHDPDKPKYDRIGYMRAKLDDLERRQKPENLVDISNTSMVMFEEDFGGVCDEFEDDGHIHTMIKR
jgi:hypothetical protein